MGGRRLVGARTACVVWRAIGKAGTRGAEDGGNRLALGVRRVASGAAPLAKV